MKYDFKKWKFIELCTWMDGGTVTLNYKDIDNKLSTIEIVQSASTDYYQEISNIPGRIYVNNELIARRSIEEDQVVKKLEIEISNLQSDLDKEILLEKINWINSNKYLDLKPRKKILSEERK